MRRHAPPRLALLAALQLAALQLAALPLAGCSDSKTAPALDRAVSEAAPALDALPGERGAVDSGSAAEAAPVEPVPLVVLHVTDLHVGSGDYAMASLGYVLSEVLPTIAPALTIDSGDTTDGGTTDQWTAYQGVVQGKVPTWPGYLEVPGNHDWKYDDGKSFMAGSQTGKAGGGAYGVSTVEAPGGAARVLRTNTADSNLVPQALAGYVTKDQQDLLASQLAAAPPAVHSIAVGHHPIDSLLGLKVLGTSSRMKDLLKQAAAEVYLCGHVHSSDLTWVGSTLSIQGPTLGDTGSLKTELGFVVLALDETGPAARVVGLAADTPKVTWPVALITTPADPALGGTNPRAKPIAPGASLKVRAVAFAPSGIQQADVSLGSGAWTSMSARGGGQRLWAASLSAPQEPGKYTLTVSVKSAEGTGSHAISVEVGP